MESQLQNRRHPPPGFLLELDERVEVPRIDHDRLLADRIGAGAQGHPDVRVVQIVGRADAQVVDALFFGAAAQLLEMPVESLDLREKARVESEAIEDADGIVWIGGRDEPVPGRANGFEM